MNELLANLPLLIFLIVLINYLTWTFFITYHLSKFGVGPEPKILLTVFLAGSIIFLALNFIFFFKIEWPELYSEVLRYR